MNRKAVFVTTTTTTTTTKNSSLRQFFTLNHCPWPKYQSSIIWLSPVKKTFFFYKSISPKQQTCGKRDELLWSFLLWYFGQKRRFHFFFMSWYICFSKFIAFLLHKTLIDGLGSCGLLVDYCNVFISWTLILTAPIHCRGSIGKQVM